MLVAGRARALFVARRSMDAWVAALAGTVAGTVVCIAPSHADPVKGEGRGPAPIIYSGGALTAARPAMAATGDPVLSFEQFQGRAGSAPSGAIDLRPGARRASFGPAVSTTGPLDGAPSLASRSAFPDASPVGKPVAGPPYQVAGKWFVPTHEPDYDETGIASWYGPTFHGKPSASGEVFDQDALTAAHPTLPIPSLVRVTNLENGKTVVVRLNDRGPFVDDRIIDLSRRTAEVLDMRGKGTARVRVQYVGAAPAQANAIPQAPVDLAPQLAALAPAFAVEPLAPIALEASMTDAGDVGANNGSAGFYLQAGSFADLGNAHTLQAKVRAAGPAFVTTAQVNGSEYYRVMLGPWPSRADAERVQANLVQAGAKAIVVARIDD